MCVCSRAQVCQLIVPADQHLIVEMVPVAHIRYAGMHIATDGWAVIDRGGSTPSSGLQLLYFQSIMQISIDFQEPQFVLKVFPFTFAQLGVVKTSNRLTEPVARMSALMEQKMGQFGSGLSADCIDTIRAAGTPTELHRNWIWKPEKLTDLLDAPTFRAVHLSGAVCDSLVFVYR